MLGIRGIRRRSGKTVKQATLCRLEAVSRIESLGVREGSSLASCFRFVAVVEFVKPFNHPKADPAAPLRTGGINRGMGVYYGTPQN